MKVKVTIGTDYCGCPSESFEIECDSEKDFEEDDKYSTEILNAIWNECSHYFIELDYDVEDEEDDEDFDEDEDDEDFEEEEE